jgi:hypothetical protein
VDRRCSAEQRLRNRSSKQIDVDLAGSRTRRSGAYRELKPNIPQKKEIPMNRIAAIALFAAVTLMTAGRAMAQVNAIEVNVPFNFSIDKTTLPAGSYTFGFEYMYPDTLVVRDRAKNVMARDVGQRGSIGPGRPDALIFHRFGRQYFLSEVHFDSASNGFFLPATKLEQQSRKVSGKEELALIASH